MNSPSGFRSLTVMALAAFLLAGSAWGGLYVEQRVTSSGEGPGLQMNVRAWADGENVRVEYLESNNPIMPAGSYLLTTDAGLTVYLIRPEEQTYSVWDLEEVFRMLGQVQEMTGGVVKIKFEDAFSETLSDEPGGQVLGHSTQHRTWRTGYTMDMKVAFVKMRSEMETLSNAWIADDIRASGLQIWFGAKPPTTGDPELDSIITAGLEHIDGMVLKIEQQTTTTDKKGRKSSSSTVMEVTELREETPSAALFAMPEGFTEVPLLALAGQGEAGEDEEPANPLKGLFGRKKKDG